MSCNRCANQAAAAMAAAGVPARQVQATWAMVYQHLPRCEGCGCWMSPRNPQCANAGCGMRGEMQGEPWPWPPTLRAFTTDRGRAGQTISETDVLERMVRQRRGLGLEGARVLGGQLAQHADQATVDRLATDRELPPQVRQQLVGRASQATVRQIAAMSHETFPVRAAAVSHLDDHDMLEAILEHSVSHILCGAIRRRLDELNLTEEQAVLAARNGAGRRTPSRCDRCGAFLPRSGECQNARCPINRETDALTSRLLNGMWTGSVAINMAACRPEDIEAARQFIIANGDRRLVSHRIILPGVREGHPDHQAFLFYNEDGDLVAVSGIDWSDSRRSFCVVQREHRRQGIGRRVVQDLVRRCRERGVEIRFQTGATNAPSIALMTSCGLGEVGQSPLSRGRTALLFGEQAEVGDDPPPADAPTYIYTHDAEPVGEAAAHAARRMPARCDRCGAFLPRSGECRNARCPSNREAVAATPSRAEMDDLEQRLRQEFGFSRQHVAVLVNQIVERGDQATMDRLAIDRDLPVWIRRMFIYRASQQAIRQIATTTGGGLWVEAILLLRDHETRDAILENEPQLRQSVRFRLDELDLLGLTDEGMAEAVTEANALVLAQLLRDQAHYADPLDVDVLAGRITDQGVVDGLVTDRDLFIQVRHRLVPWASRSAVRQVAEDRHEEPTLRAVAAYYLGDHETLDTLLGDATPGLRSIIEERLNQPDVTAWRAVWAARADDPPPADAPTYTYTHDAEPVGEAAAQAARRMPSRCDRCGAFLPRSGECQNARCPSNREAVAAAPAGATEETTGVHSQTPAAAPDRPDFWSLLTGDVRTVNQWSATRSQYEALELNFDADEIGVVEVSSPSGRTYRVERGTGCNCQQRHYLLRHQDRCRHMEAVETALGWAGQEAVNWWRAGTAQDSNAAPSTDTRVADDPPPADMPTYAHQVEPGSEAAAWTARRQAEAVANDAREQAEMDAALEAFRRHQADDRPISFLDDQAWQAAQDRLSAPYEYEHENVLNGAPVTFGVEIECVPADLQDDGFGQRVVDRLRAEGLTSQTERAGYHRGVHRNSNMWGIERDGSLVGDDGLDVGMEIISPVLSDDPEHWRQLERICAIVKEEGGAVNERCGAHVHVGADRALDTDPSKWARLVCLYGGFQDVIYRMSARGRRHRGAGSGYRYARPLHRARLRPRFGSMDDVRGFYLGGGGDRNARRRVGLNFQHSRDNRVEFRQFDGTVDAEHIQQNVRLAVGMVAAATEDLPEPTEEPRHVGHHQAQGEAADDGNIRRFADLVFRRSSDKLAALRLYAQGAWQPAH